MSTRAILVSLGACHARCPLCVHGWPLATRPCPLVSARPSLPSSSATHALLAAWPEDDGEVVGEVADAGVERGVPPARLAGARSSQHGITIHNRA